MCIYDTDTSNATQDADGDEVTSHTLNDHPSIFHKAKIYGEVTQ